ncbi:MAG: hypothetical protein J1G02_03505 [Clostridiales bacterium]|nr:hypothetical protein [Clostridiales bacterium]
MKSVRNRLISILISLVAILSTVVGFISHSTLVAYCETDSFATREDVETLEQLRLTPTEHIVTWDQYNSNDYGIVTSVKNQGNTNLCWVYGSFAAMETNILRQGFTNETKDTIDLDEKQFSMAEHGKWDDPLNLADTDKNRKNDKSIDWNTEGAISWVTQFAARGQGIYQEGEITSEEPQERYSSYFLRNAINCSNDVSEIKKLIATYGGVAFAYHSGLMNKTYLYATGSNDHASFIVGWDDNIDKSAFFHPNGLTPKRNGGWIVKNSYGIDEFENGYCYLSYDSVLYEITAFDMMSADEYDWCYNYSDLVYSAKGYSSCNPSDADSAEYAAIYKAQKGSETNEYLKSVSVGVAGTNARVDVSIFANVDEAATKYSSNSSTFNPKKGELVATATCTVPHTGIYTIPIAQMPKLDIDTYFTILVKVTGGSVIYDFFAYRSGTMTFVYDQGKWDNLYSPMGGIAINGLLCIKAHTVNSEPEEESFDISNGALELSDMTYFYTGNEHTPDVTVILNGITVPSENYTVTYQNNINAGVATVKVIGNGKYNGSLQTTFTIAKALRTNFNVKIDDWTYGEVSKSPIVSDYGMEKGNVTYSYGESYDGPFDSQIPVNAGTYFIRAEMAETDNYMSAEAVSEFTIRRAESPNLPNEFANLSATAYMELLSDIQLPAHWAWESPSTQLVPGKMQVTVMYVGEDCENYVKTAFLIELIVPEPEHRHELTPVEAVKSTCTDAGHTAYYTCNSCNKWFEDNEGKKEIIDHKSVETPLAAHDYADVEWSTSADVHWQVCNVCSQSSEKVSHSFADKQDKSQHWKQCSICDYETPKNDHDREGEQGSCSICGYKDTESKPELEPDPMPEPEPDPKPDPEGPTEPQDPSEDSPSGDDIPSPSRNKIGVIVGVGIGVVVVLGLLIFVVIYRNKKTK